MKYKLIKLVNGDLHISEDIILTDENPTVIIDDADISKISSFKLYKTKNPFCKVVEIAEESKVVKDLK